VATIVEVTSEKHEVVSRQSTTKPELPSANYIKRKGNPKDFESIEMSKPSNYHGSGFRDAVPVETLAKVQDTRLSTNMKNEQTINTSGYEERNGGPVPIKLPNDAAFSNDRVKNNRSDNRNFENKPSFQGDMNPNDGNIPIGTFRRSVRSPRVFNRNDEIPVVGNDMNPNNANRPKGNFRRSVRSARDFNGNDEIPVVGNYMNPNNRPLRRFKTNTRPLLNGVHKNPNITIGVNPIDVNHPVRGFENAVRPYGGNIDGNVEFPAATNEVNRSFRQDYRGVENKPSFQNSRIQHKMNRPLGNTVDQAKSPLRFNTTDKIQTNGGNRDEMNPPLGTILRRIISPRLDGNETVANGGKPNVGNRPLGTSEKIARPPRDGFNGNNDENRTNRASKSRSFGNDKIRTSDSSDKGFRDRFETGNNEEFEEGPSISDKLKRKPKKTFSKFKDDEGGESESRTPRFQNQSQFRQRGNFRKKKSVIPLIKVTVQLPPSLTVRELSLRSGIKISSLIQRLVETGGLASDGSAGQGGVEVGCKISRHLLNSLKLEARTGRKRVGRQEVSTIAENLVLSSSIAELLMLEFGLECVAETEKVLDEYRTDPDSFKNSVSLISRDPIVTIMGHVDHGKTTLLDSLRNTKVASGEAGGITQTVGAFSVEVEGQRIVFLDTPGHEAFTSMRKCGSLLTDIIVLVVAATDGIQPQTIESIELANASSVPIIVALTKTDMPGIDLATARSKISAELSLHDLITEDYGGPIQLVPVVAPTRQGLHELAEAILLQSQEMNLNAVRNARGEAVVLESRMLPSSGAQADIVTRWGTLKQGDHIVCGEEFGKVRQLCDTVTGAPIKSAGPSVPLKLLGLTFAPPPGSDVLVVESAKRAKQVAELRKKRRELAEAQAVYNQQALDNAITASGGVGSDAVIPELKVVPIILKADSDGTLEALRYSVDAVQMELEEQFELRSSEVTDVEESERVRTTFKVIRRSVGPVIAADIEMAKSFGAHIFGFNIRVPSKMVALSQDKRVPIVTQSVIYHLLDDLKKLMKENSPELVTIVVKGSATVLKVFHMNPTKKKEGKWAVAGCTVTQGKISKSNRLRVRRNGEVLHKSGLDSLKSFKDDVDFVSHGHECGISLSSFQDFEEGDIIEAYEEVKE